MTTEPNVETAAGFTFAGDDTKMAFLPEPRTVTPLLRCARRPTTGRRRA
jgi:hypothetical protein